mmetsp:Transcript_89058/g.276876  ORF Transcript_89058/g.276876 Transcript_89058/m.276876 type:complete len:490 (+) Transcript_89058:1-1470(+)
MGPGPETGPEPAGEQAQAQKAGQGAAGVDLDAWREDLQRLHVTLDQVVQSFISSQTRQLDTIAVELSSQKDRIVAKERCFNELSDSIACFVEDEAKKLEVWGVPIDDPESDARHEAYDAELPGPPALHRINRLWRKATKAFEATREAKEREAAAALEEQRQALEGQVAEAERRCDEQRLQREAEVRALEERLEALGAEGAQKDSASAALSQEVAGVSEQLQASKAELAAMVKRLEAMESSKSRNAYEWDAEREELVRERDSAQKSVQDLEQAASDAKHREDELVKKCADRADKLEQMKRVMDEQEREMTTKIERVQQYVKERQAGALHAEKKQQDAERMAERWQGEVRRLQAEKDKLAKLVLDLESHQSGQATEVHGIVEQHQQEVATLRSALRKKEEEMRAANLELLQQRDEEYNAKVASERQREKDRSIALLKKKEQEVHIKDQQLKAARQRIQELESGTAAAARPPSSSRRQLSEGCLPPLPLSAR